MIPPYIHEDVRSNAEKKIFNIIREDSLLNDWYCIHSLGLSRHDTKVEGELDFLLIGHDGLFALEVKGGRISRENGVWQFTDKYGFTHSKTTGPFSQVHDSLFSLRNSFFEKFGKEINNYLFGYGVIFPDINFNISSPEWDNQIIYDLSDRFSPFYEYIKRLIDYWQNKVGMKKKLNEAVIKQFVNYLRGNFERVKSLNSIIDNIEEKIINLTEQQCKALDRMDTNKRILFSGTAGTGKTLLALENAKRKAMNGKRVLILCFNRVLSARLKHIVNGLNLQGEIEVDSLHKYMYDKIVEGGFDCYLDKKSNEVDKITLYSRFYPEYFIEAIRTLDFEPYDYLVIDEGQDILSYEYFIVLDYLIKGGLEKGEWSIFYDPNKQSGLYQMYSQDLVDDLKDFGAAEYRLDVNCRNTRQIAIQTSIITDFMVEKNDIEGEKVKIRWYLSDEELLLKINSVIKELSGEGLPLEAFTILFPDKRSDYIRILDNLPWDIVEINYEIAGNPPSGKILCSTVQSYKGLENRVIIYIGIMNLSDRWFKVVNYVGMTRAKEILYLFMKSELSDDYIDRLAVFVKINS